MTTAEPAAPRMDGARPIAWGAATAALTLAVLAALFVAQWLLAVVLLDATTWGVNQIADSPVFPTPSAAELASPVLRNVILPGLAFAAAVTGAHWGFRGVRTRAWAAVAVSGVFAATVFL